MNRLFLQNAYHPPTFCSKFGFSRIRCRNYSTETETESTELKIPEETPATVTSEAALATTTSEEPLAPTTSTASDFVSIESAPRLSHAQLSRPSQVACYSRLAPYAFRYNENSCLRVFKEPEPQANLTRGSRSFFGRDLEVLKLLHRPAALDPAVQACLERPKGYRALLQADVVATQGAIVSLLQGFGTLNVSYIDGKLYLEGHEEVKKQIKINQAGYVARYGFQRSCTELYFPAMKEYHPSGFSSWVAVVSRKIGGLNLLVAGEVSCVADQYTARPECYLDLRCRRISSPESSKRPKDWIDWFYDAHVLGVPAILVGYRDENNILHRTELIQTDRLPEMINGAREKPFNPEDAIDSCFRALYVLRNYCQEAVDEREFRNIRARDNVVWRVELRGASKNGMHLRALTAEEINSQLDGGADVNNRAVLKRVGTIGTNLVVNMKKLERLQ